jgi:hypothetical protein
MAIQTVGELISALEQLDENDQPQLKVQVEIDGALHTKVVDINNITQRSMGDRVIVELS